jgi:hypothetical protein
MLYTLEVHLNKSFPYRFAGHGGQDWTGTLDIHIGQASTRRNTVQSDRQVGCMGQHPRDKQARHAGEAGKKDRLEVYCEK